jgi:hypothetical protein
MDLTLKEWLAAGKERYGDDMKQWKFRCPSCGYVQCPEDFRQFKEQGATPDDARFNCIGRYVANSKKAFGNKAFKKGEGPCDYTGGGLFRLGPLTVKPEGGPGMSSFDFADRPLANAT